MKSPYGFLATLSLISAPALAQDTSTATTTTTRKTTVKAADGKAITYTGTVTEYVPNRSIIIRDSNQKLVTYRLTPGLVIPEDVQVGKSVTIFAEPSSDGSIVRKVTTTSVTDEGNIKTTTQSTKTMPDGSSLTTTGTVVEFVPKKSMVIRDAENRRITYQLRPEVTIPTEVEVGKSVTVHADPVDGGLASATQVTVTSVTPEGDVKTSTRTTQTAADGSTTTTEETTVEGVVSAYQASKTVTVQRPDGSTVTYTLDGSAVVPADLAIGKRVFLRVGPQGQQRIVRKVTYTNAKY